MWRRQILFFGLCFGAAYGGLCPLLEFNDDDIVMASDVSVKEITTADMDGDLDTDVLMVSWETDGTQLVWYENDPDRSTLRWPARSIATHTNRGAGCAAVDVNHDGLMDVIFATTAALYVYERVGTYEFQEHELTNVHASDGLATLTAVDFDADGIVDAVLCSRNAGCFRYAIDDTFTTSGLIVLAESTDVRVVQSVVIQDVDGINGLDLVVAAHGTTDTPTNVAVFLNNGFSQDLPRTTLSESVPKAQAIALYDMDDDGDLDVIVSDRGENTQENYGELVFFEHLGQGEFAGATVIASGATELSARGLQTMAIGDLGNPSPPSLVTGTSITNNLAWWDRQNNDLNVAESRYTGGADAGKIWSLAIADITNDGANDIIFGTRDLAYFENKCPNTTMPPATMPETSMQPTPQFPKHLPSSTPQPSPQDSVPPTLEPTPMSLERHDGGKKRSIKKKWSYAVVIAAATFAGVVLVLTFLACCWGVDEIDKSQFKKKNANGSYEFDANGAHVLDEDEYSRNSFQRHVQLPVLVSFRVFTFILTVLALIEFAIHKLVLPTILYGAFITITFTARCCFALYVIYCGGGAQFDPPRNIDGNLTTKKAKASWVILSGFSAYFIWEHLRWYQHKNYRNLYEGNEGPKCCGAFAILPIMVIAFIVWVVIDIVLLVQGYDNNEVPAYTWGILIVKDFCHIASVLLEWSPLCRAGPTAPPDPREVANRRSETEMKQI